MKKGFALLLASCLFLAACQKAPEHPTEMPTEHPTEIPTEHPTEMPTEHSTEMPTEHPLITELNSIFGTWVSWYNMALTSEYDTPSQINLYNLFYLGFEDEPHQLTDAEKAELKEKTDMDFETRRLPVDKMNAVLTQYFGITLQDVDASGFAGLVYLESTNCYYHLANDALVLDGFQVTGLEFLADGTMRMSYKTQDADICVAVIKPNGDGYQILSNKIVGHPAVAGDARLKEYEELFADTEGWYRQALICQYASPYQINLKAFFYNGFADESREPTDEERVALQNMPGIDLSLDLIRLPVNKINAVLEQSFDITLWGVHASGFAGLVYLESTNCYYHTAGDTRLVENFKLIRADLQLDRGSVRLYYTLDTDQVYVVKVYPYGIYSNQKA